MVLRLCFVLEFSKATEAGGQKGSERALNDNVRKGQAYRVEGLEGWGCVRPKDGKLVSGTRTDRHGSADGREMERSGEQIADKIDCAFLDISAGQGK